MENIPIYAAIDIGSNTVQLMLAQVENSQIIAHTTHIITTRLGAVLKDNRLTEQAVTATAAALKQFIAMAESAHAKRIRIIATSAVRDAANQEQLLKALAEITPIPIEILSGEEEAMMSFRGAAINLDFPPGTLVIDVGGSSTELIYQADRDKFCWQSINVGAVRMQQNNWSQAELQQIINRARSGLAPLKADFAVGIGGTITTIAGMIQGLESFQRDAIEGIFISKEQLQALLQELEPLSIEQRRAYSPLLSQRGEIIVEGIIIWITLLNILKLKKFLVCGGGILDGAIADMI